jgi:hypothetical protein
MRSAEARATKEKRANFPILGSRRFGEPAGFFRAASRGAKLPLFCRLARHLLVVKAEFRRFGEVFLSQQ